MSSTGLVIFDLDGTLVDQEAAVKQWVDDFIREYDAEYALRTWIVDQLTARMPKDQAFARIVDRSAAAVESSTLWDDYRSRMPQLVTLFPDVARALRDLREAGWMLGIATNGMADNQIGKIERTGLDALVDGWIVSSEIGIRKPDPGLLIALAERLDAPLEGWMVGDGFETDVEAGRRAGLRTAWVTDRPRAGTAADLVVGDVPQFAVEVISR
ncbi:HAD family hydrolase [Microbacterium sp. ARD32]|uniref:HAD family hydrolase n=1 Tax=Microbacterium sp. ARD32 TaxID=2962577 RepID=UPI0028821F7D|nr:HAD family hydrolase [Microbacterium sp. ARD32]MDT0156708.1 HAD family hydrolase [Microbacterium sp. ARD32]